MGALWSIYKLVLSFIRICIHGNVSRKRKDNKTVMEHKKHDNQKWNITRSPEFRIRDKSENREQ